MCVCMRVFVCVCVGGMHADRFVNLYVYVYIYIYIYIHTHTYIYIYIHMKKNR